MSLTAQLRRHRTRWICVFGFVLLLVASLGAASEDFSELKARAEKGDAEAQFTVGKMYLESDVVAKDEREAVKWFLKAAEQGHAGSQLILGPMYHKGQGVTQDYGEATKWFRKAAEQGYANAQLNVAYMYQNGIGIAKNDSEALKWFRKAAEQGNAQAQQILNKLKPSSEVQEINDELDRLKSRAEQGDAEAQQLLGDMYYMGEGVPKDDAEALKWWNMAEEQELAQAQEILNARKSSENVNVQVKGNEYNQLKNRAEQGDANAQFNLGLMYATGRGVAQDYAEAVKWYRMAAELGNSDAQRNLGLMYQKGDGVTKDFGEALKWYRRAVAQGYAVAQNDLGEMYYFERGVRKDNAEAVRWYVKASKQGDANAQFNLGLMYATGQGVAQNYTEALKWWRKAAEQGHTKAQHNLGAMYYSGRGVTQDYAEAAKWYLKAAEQGHAKAQYNLGGVYATGQGVAQNYTEALKWYLKAAKQGLAQAQFNLGVLYAAGQGVTQDDAEATKWFRKAAGQDLAEAQSILDRRNTTGVWAVSAEGTGKHTDQGSTGPLRVDLKQALRVPPEALARGYLAIKRALLTARLAEGGQITVHQAIDGRQDTITKSNASLYIKAYEERLQTYSKAIEKRGYKQLATAYDATASPGCEKVGLFSAPTLLDQEGFTFTLSLGRFKHSGVIVESSLAVVHAMNPEITLLGKIKNDQILFNVALRGLTAKSGPSECTLTLIEKKNLDTTYAVAYTGRGLAWFQERQYGKAIADLKEAIRLDRNFAAAYNILGQIWASCPDTSYRDGKRAVEFATKACELTDWKESNCFVTLAAAYIESGDLEQAAHWISRVVELAPENEKVKVRYRIDRQLYGGVVNNLSKIVIAAQRYMKDKDVDRVTFHDLVESKDNPLIIKPEQGEDYSKIIVTKGTTDISVTLESGYTVKYLKPDSSLLLQQLKPAISNAKED